MYLLQYIHLEDIKLDFRTSPEVTIYCSTMEPIYGISCKSIRKEAWLVSSWTFTLQYFHNKKYKLIWNTIIIRQNIYYSKQQHEQE